ncbi:UDP-N-acetylglucosamine--dolichyl-phosphate N-acetylglucosaminephosphotransferase [Gracilariopsis chorda]|uniref:UDP-N-acetylglucosamine--dolichyl-phosphate N-acetylglucosaminephosphotransferase n=1 Tax=Gracilariopsis chorda TaxID=448386 RepID=A0A2V3J1N1_9FLOR|nr:UDP-N-acetylglucosamine--dolichyl-phosphate N-acetylglucosaminephosphotransferase [Gracilariopsis chorda]|eukprot:PXF47877.1 UDP-N-acetylglucosamine--dolichyl-phosphate N-acetylglucosaminephosphotransferase [Gracilariopsis chorda]
MSSSSTQDELPLRIFASSVILLVYSFICREASDAGMLFRILVVGGISVVSYFTVSFFISSVIPLFLKAGLFGRDINKKGTPNGEEKVPEPLGLVPATVYIMILCVLHLVAFHNGDARLYTAAMACVTFMTLLGFADDVLDLRWRYKLVLPLIASLPLLVNYTGKTTVILPRIIRPFVGWIASHFGGGLVGSVSGRLVDLGLGYYIYMAMLSVFCTNAINIYAGINGLEVGQSVVMAIFVTIHNALNLRSDIPKDDIHLLRVHHAFSLDMMLPFIAVCLGLMYHNWYPSRVFVGDTFCYFAGMTFAMGSILGHYSTTLLLFFVPQIINFVYSLPQLFGILPCPRHRLPKYNVKTARLEGVKTHLNLVNLVLLITGPLHERTLCFLLLVLQAVCCSLALVLRALYLRYFP